MCEKRGSRVVLEPLLCFALCCLFRVLVFQNVANSIRSEVVAVLGDGQDGAESGKSALGIFAAVDPLGDSLDVGFVGHRYFLLDFLEGAVVQ